MFPIAPKDTRLLGLEGRPSDLFDQKSSPPVMQSFDQHRAASMMNDAAGADLETRCHRVRSTVALPQAPELESATCKTPQESVSSGAVVNVPQSARNLLLPSDIPGLRRTIICPTYRASLEAFIHHLSLRSSKPFYRTGSGLARSQ